MKRPLLQKESFHVNLLALWSESLRLARRQICLDVSREIAHFRGSEPSELKVLVIGKVAPHFFDCLPVSLKTKAVVIGPSWNFGNSWNSESSSALEWIEGDHPIPGEKSFAAAEMLVQHLSAFNDYSYSWANGARPTKKLLVLLSGGASSMLWLECPSNKQKGVTASLRTQLAALYRSSLTIKELNSTRSDLCGLKGGGAFRLLKLINPKIEIKVLIVSDVAPYGPETVGSGPFWIKGQSDRFHKIVFESKYWRDIWASLLDSKKSVAAAPILKSKWLKQDSILETKNTLVKEIRASLKRGQKGFMIFGCEPTVALQDSPSKAHEGQRRDKSGVKQRGGPKGGHRGGRMSHLSLMLWLELQEEFIQKKVQILCATSDGRDGSSEHAAVWIHGPAPLLCLDKIRNAVRSQSSSRMISYLLKRQKPLLSTICAHPSCLSGLNVQDVVVVQIMN